MTREQDEANEAAANEAARKQKKAVYDKDRKVKIRKEKEKDLAKEAARKQRKAVYEKGRKEKIKKEKEKALSVAANNNSNNDELTVGPTGTNKAASKELEEANAEIKRLKDFMSETNAEIKRLKKVVQLLSAPLT